MDGWSYIAGNTNAIYRKDCYNKDFLGNSGGMVLDVDEKAQL